MLNVAVHPTDIQERYSGARKATTPSNCDATRPRNPASLASGAALEIKKPVGLRRLRRCTSRRNQHGQPGRITYKMAWRLLGCGWGAKWQPRGWSQQALRNTLTLSAQPFHRIVTEAVVCCPKALIAVTLMTCVPREIVEPCHVVEQVIVGNVHV